MFITKRIMFVKIYNNNIIQKKVPIIQFYDYKCLENYLTYSQDSETLKSPQLFIYINKHKCSYANKI